MTSESIGEITNSTTSADDKIQQRIVELYDEAKGVISKNYGFGASYLDSEIVRTETGCTKLLITAGSNPASAEFTDEEKLALYSEITTIINGERVVIPFSDFASKNITKDQIKVYVSDYLIFGDVYSLPESTTLALDAFVLPLIERYTNASNILLRSTLKEITFANDSEALTSEELNADFKTNYKRSDYLDSYEDITKRTLDSYTDKYPNWWTNMYPGGNK